MHYPVHYGSLRYGHGVQPNDDTAAPESRRAAITDYLRQEIGRRKPGDRLPTIAELLDQFSLRSVQTVRMAYAPLIREGLVTVPPKIRRYVVADPQQRPPVDHTPTAQDVAGYLREAADRLIQAAAALEAIEMANPHQRRS